MEDAFFVTIAMVAVASVAWIIQSAGISERGQSTGVVERIVKQTRPLAEIRLGIRGFQAAFAAQGRTFN